MCLFSIITCITGQAIIMFRSDNYGGFLARKRVKAAIQPR